MSYCRWSDGDVYAYDSVEGGVRFYVSRKKDEHLNRLCRTYNEAYQYMKSLRDEHGLDVPDYAIEALKEDALEEFDRLAGPDGAVAELVAENDKLRKFTTEAWELLTCNEPVFVWSGLQEKARELGIEAD